METLLLIGLGLGTAIGLVHAGYVFRHVLRDAPAVCRWQLGTMAGAAYHALWTLLLWGIFGSYVLFMWVVSVVVYTAYLGARIVKRVPETSGRAPT